MVNQNECSSISPFLALCKLASRERWCWNLICGTCAHSHFRYAFKELVCGKHPDNEGWVVNRNTRITKEVSQTLPSRARGGFTEQEQEILTQIVLQASLEDIKEVSKFPDWLGYLGLVLTYCGNQKVQLSEVWAQQFLKMLPQPCRAYNTMLEIERGLRCISLNDLESVESALCGYF